MLPDEIIDQLTLVQRRLPVEALRAADTQRAELTPRLLTCLADVVANPALLEDDPDLQLPFFAMYLLAAWRERLAHPLLLGFLRLPGEQCVDLSGDIVTEDMCRMLAQTSGGDPAGILALARDPAVNQWARLAAIKALSLLTAWGELPRARLVAYYRDLLATEGPPANGAEPGLVATEILCCAHDVGLGEMRDELLVLYDRGWIDETVVGSRDDVVAGFTRPPVPTTPPIDDVVRAVDWWQCFEREPRGQRAPTPPGDDPPPDRLVGGDRSWSEDGMPQPYRAPPKIGRNDPCPCGSGKKYKKCCLT
jgi:hypothetical protein